MEKRDLPSVEILSPREQQIMQEMVNGCRRHDIARNLDISLATVDTHASKIRKKLHARTREESIAIWTRFNDVFSGDAIDPRIRNKLIAEVNEVTKQLKKLEKSNKIAQQDAVGLQRRLDVIKSLVKDEPKLPNR
jgi:DNA-binding CsgD family transcriptional regulator